MPLPGYEQFRMAAELHQKLFPRVASIDGDSPRMEAIMIALAEACAYGESIEGFPATPNRADGQ